MKKTLNRQGQSLVEVMLALSVLTVGFLGILTLLAQSIHISKTLSDQTTAAYLAAEGIEVAKNLIDHDMYQGVEQVPGALGWGSCFGSGGGFELDYTTADCTLLGSSGYNPGNLDLLYYDPVSHLYLYPGHDLTGTSIPTVFSRLVRITPNGANEITVQSNVYWSSGLTSQEVDLEDDFYNWHP